MMDGVELTPLMLADATSVGGVTVLPLDSVNCELMLADGKCQLRFPNGVQVRFTSYRRAALSHMCYVSTVLIATVFQIIILIGQTGTMSEWDSLLLGSS